MHDTPQQNGVVERMHGTIMSMVHVNLLQAKLPLTLWGEALRYSVCIHNRTPRAAIGFDTPYCKRHNKVYVFNELHMFGQHVIIHNPDSPKIEPRGLPGQYLGPDPFSPGHRIWINGKISVEHSVQFLESTHPRIEGEKHKCHDIKCNTQSSGNMPDTEHEIVPREQ